MKNLTPKIFDKLFKDAMIDNIMRPNAFESLDGLCREYTELSNRRWKRRRELRDKIASRSIQEYLYKQYKKNN